MGRSNRVNQGGLVYHVLNRGNARMDVFDDAGDYAAFENILEQAVQRESMRLLSYCLMPNHWHMLVWPRRDGDLSRFVGWLTLTHTQRWHAHRHTSGEGHVYQGRFKSFLVQDDTHFVTVARYVERNPLRAELVDRAEAWRWSSLWQGRARVSDRTVTLCDWPVPRPRQWLRHVNRPQTAAELDAIHHSLRRGCPFGGERWVNRQISRFGLESTTRPRGRPKKDAEHQGS